MSESRIDINKLDTSERLRLIERLWDSLEDDANAMPLTAEQRAELDRRLDEIDAGETGGIPWDDVLRQVRDRLG